MLRFVRGQQRYRTLVLTTRCDDSSRETAAAAGATTYVTKPFAPQALAATARTLLNTVEPPAVRAW